jgi:Undecaprenyl-phosphate glucose phosphotransferase
MSTKYRAIVVVLFRIADVAVVCAAWLASYEARLWSPRFGQPELPPFGVYASLIPLLALLWPVTFSAFEVYHSGRMRGRMSEALLLLRAHAAALLIFLLIAYSFDAYRYSRLVMLYFGAIGAFGLVTFRVGLRTVLRTLRRRGFDLRPVLIVGGAETVATVTGMFKEYPELGMHVVGLVTSDGAALASAPGVRVLGRFAELTAVVEEYQPQEVVVALDADEQRHLRKLLDALRDVTASVRIIPDVRAHVPIGCNIDHFAGLPVLRLNDSPMETWHWVAKRCLDAVLSAAGLIVLFPLLLVIAALVKLTSPGPALYSQERMGLDGQVFQMLKFRSMRVDAEANSGAGWTTKNDARRTLIGGFLRRTSLDELPQLWNVLVGHMSLVGPRPERPVFVREFRRQIPDYMLRHKVKAGITGWAQVNGWRGDTSLVERTACDLYYIRNWSLDLDLKILVLTLWKGFVNRNAY